MDIYEGNSKYWENNVCIGKTEIKFDRYYEAEEYEVKITAKLDNNGLLEIYATKLDDNNIVATFQRHLGIQTNLISNEMKQEIAAQKEANYKRLYIEGLEDEFEDLVLDIIRHGNVDYQQIHQWRERTQKFTTIKEWSELINEGENYYDEITNVRNKNITLNKDNPMILNDENEGMISIYNIILHLKYNINNIYNR